MNDNQVYRRLLFYVLSIHSNCTCIQRNFQEAEIQLSKTSSSKWRSNRGENWSLGGFALHPNLLVQSQAQVWALSCVLWFCECPFLSFLCIYLWPETLTTCNLMGITFFPVGKNKRWLHFLGSRQEWDFTLFLSVAAWLALRGQHIWKISGYVKLLN